MKLEPFPQSDVKVDKRNNPPLPENNPRGPLSGDLYQYLFEHSVIAKTITLPDGTVTPNQAFCMMLGYDLEELSEINWKDLTLQEDIKETQDFVERMLSGEIDFCHLEKRYIQKGGNVIWGELHSSLRRDAEGRPMYFINTILDITDRKKLELELETNELNFRMIIENLPIGIAVNSVDPVVQFSYMNQHFPKLYRSTREKLSSTDQFWDSVYDDPAFREQMKKRVLDDIQTNDPSIMHWDDIPITRIGEETTYISARNIPIPNSPLMISTVWDVTERKKADLELNRLSNEMQMMFDNMINAFVVWESVFDADGNYVSFRFGKFNRAYGEIAHLNFNEVHGRDVFEVWPETEPGWVQIYGKVATTGEAQVFDMFHTPTNCWYHCNAYRPTSSPDYICVIFDDITRTRQDGEKLQKIQTLLNDTQRIAKIGGWQYDIANRVITWTDSVYDIYGVARDFDQSDPANNIMFYLDDDQKKISAALDEAITIGNSYDLELQLKKASGETIWVRTIGIPELDSDKVVRITGYIMDITEKKLSEIRMNEQLEELKRWQQVLLNREDRSIQLKQEVNELSARLGEKAKYPSVD
jgi:PAS domain S-box-containing protein